MLPPLMPPLTRGRKQRAIRESPLQPVGNGLDRSVNLPTCWGRLPHSVREMSRSDRGRPPPSAGGTRKARDGGASYIKIYGRAWKPAPTNGAPSRRPLRSNCFLCVGNGLDRSANLPIYWGRLPHSVREMSQSDRGRPPPSAGGTRKARDGGANHIKIDGRFVNRPYGWIDKSQFV